MEEFIKAKIEEARAENRDIPVIIEEMFLHIAREIDSNDHKKHPAKKAHAD